MHEIQELEKLLGNLIPAFIGTAMIGLVGLSLYSLLIQGVGRSTRPRIAEDAFELKRLSQKKRDRLAAWTPPMRVGSWNRLVREHDGNRIRAMMHRRKHQRRIRWCAWVLSAVLFVELLSIAIAQSELVLREEEVNAVSIARTVGWMLMALFIWMLPSGLVEWLNQRFDHKYSPAIWRVLHASSFVRDPALETPRAVRDLELPEGGLVPVSVAEAALYRIEAELLLTFSKPRDGFAADIVKWESSTRHRLNDVIAAKAELLDAPGDEVELERIYAWLDRVTDVLLTRVSALHDSQDTQFAQTRMSRSMRRRALGTLNLSFWGNSLFPAVFFLAMPTVILLGASLAPLFELAPWAGAIATALLPVVVGALLAAADRFLVSRQSAS